MVFNSNIEPQQIYPIIPAQSETIISQHNTFKLATIQQLCKTAAEEQNTHKTGTKHKTKQYAHRRWTSQSMRLFFEDIAKKYSMDPLLPLTWKELSASSIILEVFLAFEFIILN